MRCSRGCARASPPTILRPTAARSSGSRQSSRSSKVTTARMRRSRAAQDTRQGRAPGALPRYPAEPVLRRCRASLARPVARTARASSSRSRSAATCRVRARSTARCASVFEESSIYPHRPLPRQGARAEPAVLPFCQFVHRADLEPHPRRQRADHDGRDLRHRGTRPAVRGARRDPRRRAEPPAAGAVDTRDGAAGGHGRRSDARREDARCCVPCARPIDAT